SNAVAGRFSLKPSFETACQRSTATLRCHFTATTFAWKSRGRFFHQLNTPPNAHSPKMKSTPPMTTFHVEPNALAAGGGRRGAELLGGGGGGGPSLASAPSTAEAPQLPQPESLRRWSLPQ